MTQAAVLAQMGSQNQTFRNRIINGAMMIDQRNAGASVTPTTTSTYTLDRWSAQLSVTSKYSVQQNAGSVTPPVGFTNYLGCTSLSAYTVGTSEFFGIRQIIEGLNIADLAWGTANAKTITLSFWVYSSLTGTFGGSLRNGATDRSYPFSYSIPVANTWTQISITIAGDTTGTWLTNNQGGLNLFFSLGAGSTLSGTAGAWAGANYNSATGATSVVGTNGATFYITGVQLEKGSTATPFEQRLYGTELALCQRYYQAGQLFVRGNSAISGFVYYWVSWPVQMRTSPTVTLSSTTYSNGSSGSANAPNQYGTEFAFSVSGVSAYMLTNYGSTAEL